MVAVSDSRKAFEARNEFCDKLRPSQPYPFSSVRESARSRATTKSWSLCDWSSAMNRMLPCGCNYRSAGFGILPLLCEDSVAEAERSDRVNAEGLGARCFLKIEAEPRFKPLPVGIDQRDKRDWHTADERGELGQFVETFLRFGIKNPLGRARNRSASLAGSGKLISTI
jgi:hypothetical protein